jgi:hypothetical protein
MAFLDEQNRSQSQGGSPRNGDRAAQSSQSANAASFAAFVSAIERLEQVIDLETKILHEHKSADLREFNHRKSYGLLELNRALRALGDAASSEDVRLLLARLRAKLERNRSVLRTHLQAVREIAAIITRVIEDDDSDGTYDAFGGGYGRTL